MRLIAIYGTIKSGNHLISQWLIENLIREYYTETQILNNKLRYLVNVLIGDTIAYYNDISNFPPRKIFDKKNVIVSIEDKYHSVKVDDKDVVYDKIFVVRDPRNVWASQKVAKEKKLLDKRFPTMEEFLELNKNLYKDAKDVNGIVVNYDRFISDPEYEKEIAEKLKINLKFPYSSIVKIDQGPGRTSFDTTDYKERWKTLDTSELETLEAIFNEYKEFVNPEQDVISILSSESKDEGTVAWKPLSV